MVRNRKGRHLTQPPLKLASFQIVVTGPPCTLDQVHQPSSPLQGSGLLLFLSPTTVVDRATASSNQSQLTGLKK